MKGTGPRSSKNPPPPGWNKTIDDLFEEMKQGKRMGATSEESDWAIEYERSLLPPGTVFPKRHQIWEATENCKVQVSYLFAAPAGSGGSGSLAAGERVRIGHCGFNLPPLIIDFKPLRYDELHENLVPSDIRRVPRYTGYSLTVKTAYFNECFRLVEDVPKPPRKRKPARKPK